ncbi:MAG: biotin-dependent carboxyltransferase [Opitutaceae bacterium]|nr:biotin-dependent carboxyltransferase [Opitutaceae bacterium]
MEMTVIRPGALSTVQDMGRRGHRAVGVPSGGAADAWSLRLANLMVGNAENEAALEMNLSGAELEFSAGILVAVAGADMGGGFEPGRPRWVGAGERLRFAAPQSGCRTYLAVAGGFAVPTVLGGKGTDLRAGFGGWHGRALRAGDVLPINACSRKVTGRWRVHPELLPAIPNPATVRMLPGAQQDEFAESWTESEFTVDARSDRMGVRLQGPEMKRKHGRELRSIPVAPGTIQVPPSGRPIVLLADAQTIGGYPVLGHVIAVDLPLVAQLPPGARVRFVRATPEEARRSLLKRERALALLVQGLREKIK